jgi:hypothetical protein
MAVVSAWTPLAFERIAIRWFSLPNILFFWWVPVVTAVVAGAAWRWIGSDHEILPFLASITLISVGLPTAFDLELPLPGAAILDNLADGGSAIDTYLHADGRAGDAANHSWLYNFRLLDLRRKAPRGRRLSLNRHKQRGLTTHTTAPQSTLTRQQTIVRLDLVGALSPACRLVSHHFSWWPRKCIST